MSLGVAMLVALSSLGLADAPPVTTAAPPPRARLEVRAPAGCATRAELAARVALRSPRVQFAGDAALSARVAFTAPRSGTIVAELALVIAGRPPETRRVVARTCAEAADAIALILAVTLDPAGSGGASPAPSVAPAAGTDDTPTPGRENTGSHPVAAPVATADAAPRAPASATPDDGRPPPANPESTSGPAPSPAPASTAEDAPPSPGPPETTDDAASPGPEEPPGVAAAGSSPSETPLQFAAYVVGQATTGPAPRFMPGVAAYLVIALDEDGAWAPALFIGLAHSWRRGLDEPGGTAAFSLDAASLDVCPLRLRTASLEFRPCASTLAGRLVANGTNTEQATSSARPYWAAGLALNASLGDTFVLLGRVGLDLTLVRDSYEFGDVDFHRADRFTISAGLGVGARWP